MPKGRAWSAAIPRYAFAARAFPRWCGRASAHWCCRRARHAANVIFGGIPGQLFSRSADPLPPLLLPLVRLDDHAMTAFLCAAAQAPDYFAHRGAGLEQIGDAAEQMM